MVKTFGNNIADAYTKGEGISKIFSNGDLVWEKDVLPSGYTRVDYIYNIYHDHVNSEPYYWAPDIELTVPEMSDFMMIFDYEDSYQGYGFLESYNLDVELNAYLKGDSDVNPYPGRYYLWSAYQSNTTTSQYYWNTVHTYANITRVSGQKVRAILTPNYISLNGNITLAPTTVLNIGEIDYITCSGKITISRSNSYEGCGKIYKFRIYNHGELIMNMLPALEDSTGKPGMYDTVGGTFYTTDDEFYEYGQKPFQYYLHSTN